MIKCSFDSSFELVWKYPSTFHNAPEDPVSGFQPSGLINALVPVARRSRSPEASSPYAWEVLSTFTSELLQEPPRLCKFECNGTCVSCSMKAMHALLHFSCRFSPSSRRICRNHVRALFYLQSRRVHKDGARGKKREKEHKREEKRWLVGGCINADFSIKIRIFQH